MTRSAAVFEDNGLEVQWATGRVSRLPSLWLRDNCGCEECRVTQTSEKRFLLSDVAVDVAPKTAAVVEDALIVTWPDGHISRFEGGAIRELEEPFDQIWAPWGDDFAPQRALFSMFLQDDAEAAAAIAALLRDGMLILERAPREAGLLESLSKRLGPLREVAFARIHDVYVDPGGYNVAHTALALPPHNDFASYSWPPSIQCLHMIDNEASGGESIVVDGWKVLNELRRDRPDFFEVLCTVPVPFREFDDDTETHATAPIVRCDADGQLEILRFSNQLMQTIKPNRPGVSEFYRAYHELCRRITSPEARVSFRLHAGQIMVLASHRVLHGRNAFEAVGKRHLQDAYFELDNARNHRVTLLRKLVQPHD